MRTKFRLNFESGTTLQGGMFLIHGGYASGKTHLMADFLAHYKEQGGKVKFLNVIGEDGYRSAMHSGLEEGETVESYKDMIEALQEARQEGVVAVGLDSLKAAVRLVMAHVLGSPDRLPSIGGNKNEWGEVHFSVELFTTALRGAAPWVLTTCPSDKSVNQLDGRTYITPDLPGRQAAGSAGWFDFVAYLTADVQGPGNVVRKLMFTPNGAIVTRQRLPEPIVKDVVLPNGKGGWQRVLDAINAKLK